MTQFNNTVMRQSAPLRFGDIGIGEVFLLALGNLAQPFVKLDSLRARGSSGDLLLPQHEFPVVLVETN